MFKPKFSSRKIIGTVGVLQFEVIQHRLLNEYNASCAFESMEISKACWISSNDEDALNTFMKEQEQYMALDHDDKPVFLARSKWALDYAKEKNPKVEFHFISEHD